MKSYRFYGEEMEVLGQRLDAARAALAGAKSDWAKTHWKLTVDRLLFQWKQLPILHDGDAKVTLIPRWTIDYNYWEKAEEVKTIPMPLGNYFTSKLEDVGLQDRLRYSWEMHREARLARSQ